jgi:hypothetical protein
VRMEDLQSCHRIQGEDALKGVRSMCVACWVETRVGVVMKIQCRDEEDASSKRDASWPIITQIGNCDRTDLVSESRTYRFNRHRYYLLKPDHFQEPKQISQGKWLRKTANPRGRGRESPELLVDTMPV